MKVDIDELKECLRYIDKINSCDLKDIEWFKNGKKKRVSQKSLDEFKFIGLSNTWFARSYKKWFK